VPILSDYVPLVVEGSEKLLMETPRLRE
jgi:hypothetical protein